VRGSIWAWEYHWWRLARCWLLAACTAATGSLIPGQRTSHHQESKPGRNGSCMSPSSRSPFAFLVARPEGVKAGVERFKAWLIKHALQVMGAVALVAGGYMVISGVLRLS